MIMVMVMVMCLGIIVESRPRGILCGLWVVGCVLLIIRMVPCGTHDGEAGDGYVLLGTIVDSRLWAMVCGLWVVCCKCDTFNVN